MELICFFYERFDTGVVFDHVVVRKVEMIDLRFVFVNIVVSRAVVSENLDHVHSDPVGVLLHEVAEGVALVSKSQVRNDYVLHAFARKVPRRDAIE